MAISKIGPYRLHVETRPGGGPGNREQGKGVPLGSADRWAVHLDVRARLELVPTASATHAIADSEVRNECHEHTRT